MAEKCRHEGCKTPPMLEYEYCFFHEPTFEARRNEARSKGGKAARKVLKPADLEGLDLTDLAGLNQFLVGLVQSVALGEVSAKVAHCCGYLTRSIAMVHQTSLLEGRIRQIEKVLEGIEYGS